jgi:hypothetical protein
MGHDTWRSSYLGGMLGRGKIKLLIHICNVILCSWNKRNNYYESLVSSPWWWTCLNNWNILLLWLHNLVIAARNFRTWCDPQENFGMLDALKTQFRVFESSRELNLIHSQYRFYCRFFIILNLWMVADESNVLKVWSGGGAPGSTTNFFTGFGRIS